MSDRTFEGAVSDWLESGSDRTSPAAIDAVLLAVKTTPQERDLRIPWRFHWMPTYTRLVAGIAIIAVAGVAGLILFKGPSVGPPVPSTSPTPTLSPLPSPTINPLVDTTTWSAYTSSQYGYTIGHPADWIVDPAVRPWDIDTDAADWQSPAMDDFITPNRDVRVSVWELDLAPGTIESWETIEVERWFEDVYCPKTGNAVCTGIHDRVVPLCLEIRDCHPGMLLASNDTDTQAFFSLTNEDGMTVVTIWRAENDPSTVRFGGTQRLLEAFLSTMNVWPMDRRPDPRNQQLWSPAPSP